MITTTTGRRSTIGAMLAGLGLTIVAMIILYADQAVGNVLCDHIQAGYPAMPATEVDAAATIYLIYLSIVGVLGILCWAVTIWTVATGKRWARWLASVIFDQISANRRRPETY